MKIVRPSRKRNSRNTSDADSAGESEQQGSDKWNDEYKKRHVNGPKQVSKIKPTQRKKFSAKQEQASNVNVSRPNPAIGAGDMKGSEFDIFDDDISWDKDVYVRTNASDRSTKGRIKRGTANISDKAQYEKTAPLVDGKKRRRSELGEAERGDSGAKSALEAIIDPEKKEFNSILSRGMRLLAIREHSVMEITKKLLDKFEEQGLVYAVVDELVKLKYVSDERFAESYVRSRANKGFGPIKIKAELKGKGISNNLTQDYLKECSYVWFDNAQAQYRKKYGSTPVEDYKAWTKCARFLQSRGFSMEHIHCAIPPFESH